MAIAWTITCNGVNITDDVISASWSFGRQNPLDDYSANYLTMTVQNGSGQFNATSFPISSVIILNPDNASPRPYRFWLQSVNYRDEIEPTASTATIVGIDGFGRLGQVPIFARIPPAGTTTYSRAGSVAQLSDMFTTYQIEKGNPGGVDFMSQIGNPAYHGGMSQCLSIASGGSPDQTIPPYRNLLDYANANIRTEGTVMNVAPGTLTMRSRAKMTYTDNVAIDIGGSASSTSIVWDEFERSGYGAEYFNSVTVQSELASIAPQNATGAVTTFGETRLDVSSRDTTSTQALGLAQWLAATLGSGTLMSATVSFVDGIQNPTALASFRDIDAGQSFLVYWLQAGVGVVNRRMMVEGGEVEVVPGASRYRLYLSDYELYKVFTLDDTNLGVLDDDRLGW
jgi:hypothetical protein